ncbi:SKP1-like protein 1B [Solanum tuberosum]|uniref:SKP1-like protein 1B n=1 Tax=Solanum tuberosum TaxID=4113 RepID=UPI0003D2549B|nr:PREDICTED: SKP1-like protein 1B [Solanum tuberosum]
MSSKKLITLKTSDDEEFKLDEAIVLRSEVIKNIVQDVDCTSNAIPLFNVDGKTMTTMVKYWKKHLEEGVTEYQYIDDKQLKKVIIQEFVDRITGKTLQEIREVYGFVKDYTPQEEEDVRREYAWAFE